MTFNRIADLEFDRQNRGGLPADLLLLEQLQKGCGVDFSA